MQNPIRVTARLLIVNDRDEFLLVQMGKIRAMAGGGIEDGESVAVTIAREAEEELGVRAEFDRILYIQDYIAENKGRQQHFIDFFCTVNNNEEFAQVTDHYHQATHAHELKNVQWFSLETFPATFMPQNLLPVLAAYLHNRTQTSMQYVSEISA